MRRENTVTVKEAARRLDVSEETIRAGLISKDLPIGSAVKRERSYSYIIPRDRFERYCSGEDLGLLLKLLANIISRNGGDDNEQRLRVNV